MNTPAPLHIFKPGRQTAMSGVTLDFTDADLAACAAAYDPALHEAPIVIGHPKHDAPAYGWVKSLSTNADGLMGEPHQMDVSFVEMVKSGRLKKISGSFYTPDAPANPVPGVYYLRHVGFLGAMPPAIKGLKQVEFAEAEEGVVEFGELPAGAVSRIFRGLREWMIDKFGLAEANKALSSWDVDWIQEQAAQPEPEVSPAFSEPDPVTKELTVTPEQAAALEAENTKLKGLVAFAEAEKKKLLADQRHDDHASFAEGLIADGTLAPKHKETVVALLDFADGEQVLEFGEGAAKQALPTALKGFLSELPRVVEFGEHATKGKASAADAGGVVDYGENADPERVQLDQKIRSHMREHSVDYATAANAVIK
ncbi:peptidase [Iodobacter sp. BJB302]|uniref:peptidase n=1 Tax=Iodobacter sp. BJB302 TaxID=1506510 RepID=UPI000C10A5A3|nr:peptidase [Iodobacter sp. BJB302]PHV02795.1 peptidase [Iodobacter sp. BJB302]